MVIRMFDGMGTWDDVTSFGRWSWYTPITLCVRVMRIQVQTLSY